MGPVPRARDARPPCNVLKIWSLDAAGAPTLADSINRPGIAHRERRRGELRRAVLMFSAERGGECGSLSLLPERSRRARRSSTAPWSWTGLHTATFGEIGGGRYAFAAKNPPDPALLHLRRDRPRRSSPGATVPSRRLRHPRYLRPRWAGLRLRLEHRRHHLRRGERHSGRLSLRPRRGRAALVTDAASPASPRCTMAGGSTTR